MAPLARRWIAVGTLVTLFLVGGLLMASRVPFSSGTLRARVIATLSERLDADVELGDLWLRLAPNLHAEGRDLVIRHRGRRDIPPLIAIQTVVIDSSLLALWNRQVTRVQLHGLEITIPPGGVGLRDETERASPPGGNAAEDSPIDRDVVIDEVIAADARLTVLRRNTADTPRVWQIHQLQMQRVGSRSAMPFQALLTNAIPPGQLDSTGVFGPWNRGNPGRTPIEGAFTFNDADLSVFKGIAGRLDASGTYAGSLERIDVTGQTTTPAFSLSAVSQPVPLEARYHATVDATNGNTTLEKVDARFLKTSLTARGSIHETAGVRGRTVSIDTEIGSGRIEDVMRLAVKSSPAPMTGALRVSTKVELPPGDENVIDRLQLEGAFTIEDGRFSSQNVQMKVNELSHRARGRNLQTTPSNVGSHFSGRFALARGTLKLTNVTFDVPGAIVELSGIYGLESERLALNGNVFMDARLSEAVSGWKALMLKVVDPFFRKNGRTVIPVKITGTRRKPQFGLDARRVF